MKHHTIIIDQPIDWAGLCQELKPVLTYLIGIVTGVVVTLSSQSMVPNDTSVIYSLTLV